MRNILIAFLLSFCAAVTLAQETRLLYKYDETNSSLEGHTTQILQDHNGFLWIATWNGIYRFDGYEFQRMKPNLSDSCSMTSDRIRDIWLAGNGDIYLRNDERIFHFDIKTYRFRNLRDAAELDEAQRQRENQPTRGIYIDGAQEYTDPQGLLWTFHEDALYCMSRMESPAKPLPMEKPAMVSCTKLDNRKQVWVATKEDQTLRLFDGNGQLLGYMSPDGTLSASYRVFGRSVYCITETSDNRIWIGTKPDGLFRLTPLTVPGEKPRYKVEPVEGLDNTSVYGIAEDNEGRLWIATLGGGISCVSNRNAGHPTVLNHLPGFPEDVCQRVRHIHINKEGILLAATTEGLIVARIDHDVQKMRFKRHTKDPDRGNSLSCNATMDIVETPEGRIFVATETGGINEIVNRKSSNSKRPDLLADTLAFKHYDMDAGLLPSDMTLGMALMPNGNLLVTSHTKLIILDVENNGKSSNSKSSGCFESLGHHFFHHVYHFSEARPLLLPNGHWLLGCLDGGFTLADSAAHHNNYQPPLQFTSITFYNEKPQLAVTHLDTLRLTPDERSLTIHFAALDYVDPQAVSYQYRLVTDTTGTSSNSKSSDSEWNNLGHSHSVTLLDLTPDTYLLSVRSTNADGVWTDNTRTLTIIVEPLFRETICARLLLGLLLLAIATGIVYTLVYIKSLKHKQHETLQKYLALLEENQAHQPNPQPLTRREESSGGRSLSFGGRLVGADGGDIDPFMQRVMQFVEANIANSEADVGAMADACAVSRSVLQRKMKKLMGITPNDFLREARMKHAAQMLLLTDTPVSDVAYRCGYNDPKYFSRCFRQSTGMTPTEYKSQNQALE